MLDLSRVAQRPGVTAAGSSTLESPRSYHAREPAEAEVTAAVLPLALTPRGRQWGAGSFAAAPPQQGAPTTPISSSTFSLLPSPCQQPHQSAPPSSLLMPSLWAQWSDGQSGGGAMATELTSPRSAVSSLQPVPQSEGLTSPRSAAAPSLQPLQRSRQFRAAADCLVAITEDISGIPCPFALGAACPSPRKPSSLKPMLAAANETGSAIQPQAWIASPPPQSAGDTATHTQPHTQPHTAAAAAPPLLLLSPRSRTLLPRSRALSRKLVEMHGQRVMGRHPAGASGMGGPQGAAGSNQGLGDGHLNPLIDRGQLVLGH